MLDMVAELALPIWRKPIGISWKHAREIVPVRGIASIANHVGFLLAYSVSDYNPMLQSNSVAGNPNNALYEMKIGLNGREKYKYFAITNHLLRKQAGLGADVEAVCQNVVTH